MDKETIKCYLENVANLMEEGKILKAFRELTFVIKNINIGSHNHGGKNNG